MDIAKIRKKLKEADSESRQPGAGSKAEEQQHSPAKEDNGNIFSPSTDPAIEQSAYPADPGEQSPGSDPVSSGIATSSDQRGEHREYVPEASVEHDKTEPLPAEEPGKLLPSHENGGKTEIKGEGSRTEEIIEILTFRLFKEEYAFKISQLKEILKYQRITKVPRMPDYVVGITSLRGKVIPVIDLRTKVSSRTNLPGLSDRIKILVIKGPKGLIGAVVDKVIGVVRIAKSDILPPPSHLTEEQLKFIDGIAIIDKRFVSILNMEETIAMHFN
jgi:purine-binding chemotaxis protein CheW